MKKLTVSGILLIISLCSFSQKEFTPGWVIRSNGDTLRGYLQDEIRKNIFESIKFKSEKDSSDFRTFTVAEVRAFKYDEGNLYLAISYINSSGDSSINQTCFARQLVGGTYDLFEIAEEDRKFYLIRGENSAYFLFNSVFNTNGDLAGGGNYTNRLIQLAASFNESNLSPERVDYTDKDMIKFVLALNNLISPNKPGISYYHKPKTQVKLFVFGGGLPAGNRSQLAFDVMLKLIYPQINPNLSFNFGFHYSNTMKPVLRTDYTIVKLYSQTDYQITSIPIIIQYNFTKGIIQPYIYGGLSVAYISVNPNNPYNPYDNNEIFGNHQFNLELVGGVGVEAHFTPWFMARIDWRYEYTFQLPSVGLAFKF